MMGRIRYAVAGNGWRAMFFVRAAQNLPEIFELTGVLCRTKEKAEAFQKEHGVRAFYELDALLETKPEFVVSCVTKKAISDMTMRLMERGVHVLSETPLAVDVETLERIRETRRRTGAVLEMAEQYFLYPNHQARRAVVESGLLGQVTTCWMSMMHDYHGISMLRAYMGEETGPVQIAARRIVSPITATGGRGGYVTGGEVENEYRVLAQFDFGGGRVGLHDFAGSQYHSEIRTNHLRILGTRGEIFDDQVRFLRTGNRPAVARFVTHKDEITGTVTAIDFDGKRVYENPFGAHVAMSEDDIAVCHVLERMSRSISGGGKHYPYAFRDSYMAILLTQTAQENGCTTADVMAWN